MDDLERAADELEKATSELVRRAAELARRSEELNRQLLKMAQALTRPAAVTPVEGAAGLPPPAKPREAVPPPSVKGVLDEVRELLDGRPGAPGPAPG